MTVTVPSGHPTKPRYDAIATLKTTIATNTNPTLTNRLKAQLVEEQTRLVQDLVACGALPAGAILSTMAFGATDPNA